MSVTPPREFAAHDWREAPAAPLDAMGWIGDRDCILHRICRSAEPPPTPKPLPRPAPRLVRTHRLSGPPDLDADIASVDADVRDCFRILAATGAPLPRIKITVVAPRAARTRIVAVDPPDAPTPLVTCMGDALREIRSSASAPVVIVAGAPF